MKSTAKDNEQPFFPFTADPSLCHPKLLSILVFIAVKKCASK